MKKGFEAKMAFLIEDFANKEKEMHRKEADYKTENNKIKW